VDRAVSSLQKSAEQRDPRSRGGELEEEVGEKETPSLGDRVENEKQEGRMRSGRELRI